MYLVPNYFRVNLNCVSCFYSILRSKPNIVVGNNGQKPHLDIGMKIIILDVGERIFQPTRY